MKEQTPLERLIKWIDVDNPNPTHFPDRIDIANKAKSLLPEERKAIEEAWTDGNRQEHYDGTEMSASKYYETKFKQ